jgi:methylglutaconyl-CoA hydratase
MIEAATNDGVVTITMVRPERKNALNLEMVQKIRAVLAQADNPRLVVFKSGVPGYFSVGMDLVSLDAGIGGGATSPEVHRSVGQYVDLLKDIASMRCLTVAAVGGLAVGGGVDLLASCDLAIASHDSAFSIAQLRKGIFPLTTSGVVIPRIGQRAFLYWMLTGQNYSAKKARKIGLVNQVVKLDRLDARIEQLTQQILGYDADALSLGIEAVRVGPNLTPMDRLSHLGTLLSLNCQIPRDNQ